MNADLMVRHALLAGIPSSGKAMAASLLTRPGGDERGGRVDRGDDSRARHPVTAADSKAGCGDQEVIG